VQAYKFSGKGTKQKLKKGTCHEGELHFFIQKWIIPGHRQNMIWDSELVFLPTSFCLFWRCSSDELFLLLFGVVEKKK
jgi:hypothetical protein